LNESATAASNANEPNSDGFLSILALNYCHNSLYKIIEYNDRIILDDEYNNIISNINLTKIPDQETIQVVLRLMDALTKFKLSENEKEHLNKIYEKRAEKALYDGLRFSVHSVKDGAVSAIQLNWAKAAASAANIKDVYRDYRDQMATYRLELEERIWQLESEALVEINELNKLCPPLGKLYKVNESLGF